jgi:hypothetical protein
MHADVQEAKGILDDYYQVYQQNYRTVQKIATLNGAA